MQQSTRQHCVMIIAGEASGDLHGANLVRAMHAVNPDLFVCGLGGQAMKAAGIRILVDASTLAVVGITEVLAKLPGLIKGMTTAKRLLKVLKPDLLILIDFPDFNLRVARYAKKMGVRVLYYISPQIWAWRSGRIKKIKRFVDHMAVILPFEADFYHKHGVPATFVGHPLLDKQDEKVNPGIRPGLLTSPVIGLLPGSRDHEIAVHLPLMLSAAARLRKENPEFGFVVSLASSKDASLVENIIKDSAMADDCTIVSGPVEKIFQKSDLVLAVSGTVTLEAAIAQTPMIIIYKVSPLSYWIGKKFIKVDHIGLVNLIADERVVPELVQKDATPEKIAQTALDLIKDAGRLEKTREKLHAVKAKLGNPGASGRTARLVEKLLED